MFNPFSALLDRVRSDDGAKTQEDDEETFDEDAEDECNHDWGEWQEVGDEDVGRAPVLGFDASDRMWDAPAIKDGYLIFDVAAPHERFCTECGEKYFAEPLLRADKGVIELDYYVDPDVDVPEVLGPEEPAAETVGDDGNGRVIVNEKTVDPAEGDD